LRTNSGLGGPCSRQIQQACYLIERKGQLAYHDDKCNRDEIEAVIHRPSPQKFEEGLRGKQTRYLQ
jgi:hypothetical protein